MAFGSPLSGAADAQFFMQFRHTDGSTFTLTKDFGSVSRPINPPPDISQETLTEGQLEDLLQNFADAVDASADFTFLGGSKTYQVVQDFTP